MTIDLCALAKECPGTIISIRVDDLVEANNRLIANVRQEFEQEVANRDREQFLTRSMVMKQLNVVSSTLWRWKKTGYLVPVAVGGQDRYKLSDINEIIEGAR